MNALRIFVVIILFGLDAWAGDATFVTQELQIITATNQKYTFQVEIADTQPLRETGLMWRTSMPRYAGMLFLFDQENKLNMWMKNTYLPLDMLFIRKSDDVAGGVVAKIARKTKPLSLDMIPSDEKVIAVLELNGGLCDKLGITKNDKVIWHAKNKYE